MGGGVVYMVVYIQFVYMVGVGLAKKFMGFRFDVSLYESFSRVAGAAGFTVTGAFERFMRGCVEAEALVFPEKRAVNFEVEARVFVDWLGKGKFFYRGEDGGEVNIQGRLLWLLPRVQDAALKRDIEDALKRSVSSKE